MLAANPNRFITLLLPGGTQTAVRPGSPSTSTLRLDLQFQAVKVVRLPATRLVPRMCRRDTGRAPPTSSPSPLWQIISIIVKNEDSWLASQHSLVSQLRRVWVSETFQERHRKENMAATNWKEPKLLAYCLLNYCKWVHPGSGAPWALPELWVAGVPMCVGMACGSEQREGRSDVPGSYGPLIRTRRKNYGDIELLFQLLRAFTGRFLCNMTFLKEYMEEEIPQNYNIAQKRALFFRFVDFNDPNFGDELKAKVGPSVAAGESAMLELVFPGARALCPWSAVSFLALEEQSGLFRKEVSLLRNVRQAQL